MNRHDRITQNRIVALRSTKMPVEEIIQHLNEHGDEVYGCRSTAKIYVIERLAEVGPNVHIWQGV